MCCWSPCLMAGRPKYSIIALSGSLAPPPSWLQWTAATWGDASWQQWSSLMWTTAVVVKMDYLIKVFCNHSEAPELGHPHHYPPSPAHNLTGHQHHLHHHHPAPPCPHCSWLPAEMVEYKCNLLSMSSEWCHWPALGAAGPTYRPFLPARRGLLELCRIQSAQTIKKQKRTNISGSLR